MVFKMHSINKNNILIRIFNRVEQKDEMRKICCYSPDIMHTLVGITTDEFPALGNKTYCFCQNVIMFRNVLV